jgi:imidazolonepropionase-like amidohydrolase
MPRLLLIFAWALLPAVAHAGAHTGAGSVKRADTLMVIHAGQLLAVPGEAPLAEQTVIVRNDIVEAVQAGYADPAAFETGKQERLIVVDLKKRFVLPGLMDAHVHLARATGSYQLGLPQMNAGPAPAEAAVNALINARLTLAAGFTVVRDLGSDQTSVFAVRDAIKAGKLAGPTIIASGTSVSVTAGHGGDSHSYTPDARAAAGVCDGADECRMLVRHLEKTGSDLIKIKVTGGFSSNTGLKQHMTAEEIQSVVQAAQMRGIKVAAHAYEPAAIIDALNAGVASIEHGFQLDEQGIKLMRKQNAFLVPTLTVAEPPGMIARLLGGKTPPSLAMRDEHRAFEKAYAAGVKIAFGTDGGIYPHGKNADEFVKMVELGMSEADVIVAATLNTAELFALNGYTGTIKPGSKADIIAVEGNPLEDIAVLTDVRDVIKDGRLVKSAGQVLAPLDYLLPQRY